MDIETELANLKGRVAVLEAIVGAQAPVNVQTPVAGPPTIAPPVRPSRPGSLAPLSVPTPQPAMVPVGQVMPPPPTVGSVPYSPSMPASAPPRVENSFEFGIESLLRWAGVALVTLAGIFLVSTAISRGWVGPELQLLGAAAGGAILLAGAVRLSESRRPWALALGCGGAVVMAASALATYEWLELVGPGAALGLTALATAGSIAVALRTRLEGIAIVASLAAMFGALDTLDKVGDSATMLWVGALVLLTSALGIVRQWPGLRVVVGWLGALLLAIYAVVEGADGVLRIVGFVGTALIGFTLWAGPILASRFADQTVTNRAAAGQPGPSTASSGMWGRFDWTPVDYRLVALVPGWVWTVVSGLLDLDASSDLGIAALVTAAGFGAVGALTWGQTDKLISLSTLLGSFTLVAVGFALVFDGPALMVALAGQAVTSYLLGRKLEDKTLRFGGYLAGVVSSLLAVYEMFDALDSGGFDNFGAAFATALVVSLWIGAAVVAYLRTDSDVRFEVPFVGAWIGAMIWFASVLVGLPQGLGLISAAWALMACVGLVIGLRNRIGIVRNVALGTLAVTLVKLVTVDMAEVDVFWRVGLFFVVGMGLIALGLKIPALMGTTDEANKAEPEPDSSDLML